MSKSAYISTDTGNLVSRSSSIYGSANLVLGGRTIISHGVIMRGDLRRAGATTSTGSVVVVAVGKYCEFGEGSVIRPGCKMYKG